MRTPLDVLRISREEFRLLVLLHRDGRMTRSEAEAKLSRGRQSLTETIGRAEEFGWVRRGVAHLPAAEARASRLSKEMRGEPRLGRQVGTIELTEQGERLIDRVLPKQEAILRSLLGGLDSRAMKRLIGICRQIRREDLVTQLIYARTLIREFGDEERRRGADAEPD